MVAVKVFECSVNGGSGTYNSNSATVNDRSGILLVLLLFLGVNLVGKLIGLDQGVLLVEEALGKRLLLFCVEKARGFLSCSILEEEVVEEQLGVKESFALVSEN
jgi:hypothetical protein